jgi:hypothetical protein
VREPEGRQRDWVTRRRDDNGIVFYVLSGHVPAVSQGSEGAAGLTTWTMGYEAHMAPKGCMEAG